jgi:hypothetical protein
MKRLEHLQQKGIAYLDTICMGLALPELLQEAKAVLDKI